MNAQLFLLIQSMYPNNKNLVKNDKYTRWGHTIINKNSDLQSPTKFQPILTLLG